ncbi:tellurite resistance/C4-dicarboxylate transporter family protein [Paraliobacillus sediminis]|uniref:tellurite resistance/C4-dicarboxylate transporter family protein n=1 Tax=Paraliobacillus sediminis TaxID=1885916 RepID=UPI000E3DB4B4|nr:tellurite resistance/C4-dicarboxylate transporter family protein [Paraliobacillus sediminis]
MFRFIKHKAATLFPGYFALVMATGALSIGTHLLGYVFFANVLLYINTVSYIVLWALTLLRLCKYFKNLISDLTSHTIGPGFFTLVAGTCVYGSQLIVVGSIFVVPLILWFIAICLWVIVMYTFFTAVTISKDKPDLAEGINGAWLIATVATQSISILGTLLSPHVETGREVILFFTLCMYFLGCMLYLNIITLIFYRFTFLGLKFSALTPPYWINMGAVAITTLAGSTLILHRGYWELIDVFSSFLKGFTLFFWVAGTWWIPLLLILMIWRHIYHRYPLTYEPQLWGMVFPLAMYTTSTLQLSKALEVEFLSFIPQITVFIAIIAWSILFCALILNLYKAIKTHVV